MRKKEKYLKAKTVFYFMLWIAIPLLLLEITLFYFQFSDNKKQDEFVTNLTNAITNIGKYVTFQDFELTEENLNILKTELKPLEKRNLGYEVYSLTFNQKHSILKSSHEITRKTHRIALYEGTNTYYLEFEMSYKQTHINEWLEIVVVILLNILVFIAMYLLREYYKENKNLRSYSYLDPLTDIPNRRYFMEKLENKIDEFQETQKPFALCFMDIDKFKEINDVYGHDAGDAILKITVDRLQKAAIDPSQLARIGGDEFVWILSDVKTKEECEEKVKKILENFEEPLIYQNKKISFKISIGIYFHEECCSSLDIMKCADKAMYKAKKNKRKHYSFYH